MRFIDQQGNSGADGEDEQFPDQFDLPTTSPN